MLKVSHTFPKRNNPNVIFFFNYSSVRNLYRGSIQTEIRHFEGERKLYSRREVILRKYNNR